MAIRSHKSKNDIQYISQAKRCKGANNDLQYTTQRAKDWTIRTA